MSNYSTNVSACQVDILEDVSPTGRARPWALLKKTADILSLLYSDINERKAERLANCGSWLSFVRRGDGTLSLHKANFCRVRLCPVCSWRRSLKTYGQVRAITEALGERFAYIFLTLTIPNVSGDDLKAGLDTLTIGFNRLMKYKAVGQAVKGYYRAIEVTHNIQSDTFHPHIHALIAVAPSYFTSRYYLSQAEWLKLWNKACKRSDITSLDVRRLRGNLDKACAEVAKYTVKSKDIIYFDDWDLSEKTLSILDSALSSRRFIGYGGCFAEAHKKLHLDDVEDGDLVHTEIDNVTSEQLDIITYTWHSGYCQYIK